MPRISRNFPPSSETLSVLKAGEYIVYVGTEEEVGISSHFSVPLDIEAKMQQAKKFVAHDKHVPAETLARFTPAKC